MSISQLKLTHKIYYVTMRQQYQHSTKWEKCFGVTININVARVILLLLYDDQATK